MTGDVLVAVVCVLIVARHALFVWPEDWRDEWLRWVRSLPEERR